MFKGEGGRVGLGNKGKISEASDIATSPVFTEEQKGGEVLCEEQE